MTNSGSEELLTYQKNRKYISKSCCTVGGNTPWAEGKGAPWSALKRADAKYFSPILDTNRKGGTNVPSVDKCSGFYEKSTVFVFLGKYMEGTRIMNPDKSKDSTVKKHQETLHRRVNRKRCTTHCQLLL